MDSAAKIRLAAVWLYIVAAATMANSLLIQLFSRFVDLLAGLFLTQMVDAFFVGMRSIEPPGAPPGFEAASALVLDFIIVSIFVILAVKVSRGSRRAAGIAFFFYSLDTFAFVVALGWSVWAGGKTWTLAWQALTVLVHLAGVVIIFRAWRATRGKLTSNLRAVV
jgi:hypothetical protein